MASLQQEPTGTFHVIFRVAGRRYKRSLGTKASSKAIARRDEIQETIDLINRGRLTVPSDAPIADFVLADGDTTKLASPPSQPVVQASITLGSMLQQFFESIPPDSLEETTSKTMQIHRRHLIRVLKTSLPVRELSGEHLQQYVNKRATERTRFIADKTKPKAKQTRTQVSATTIRKEIKTLGTIWRWAISAQIVDHPFPCRGIRWPKTDEKPPFQTWSEIERQIEQQQLTTSEADLLWECLYLRASEIEELLAFVKANAAQPFVYPFFAMAAYTGARRSELLRSMRADFDFDSHVVTIRERKRVKGMRSTRRVPLSASLEATISRWFEHHPGGPWTFASVSRRDDPRPAPVSRDQAHDQFRKAVGGGRWEKLKGWHCLRHSFISNLAGAGIDQRIIDEFVGHTTEEMRRRYRHLFPNVKHAAMRQVFG